ncbi:hypothetical protein PPL_10668 [Heterostelium album PN500]|uniref:Uncharacterized protein n=1 Tax=Heterostelium pallidum (strain ATCC 26659 / Pp 5 / PN500) TaxID=670386 RepID=D3BRQ7_HETP5|nr:hypothetical protein PPL_10668 [Heterostelium album PN500]EFA76089.1 hypothetical protein PPL_10668 [Heterostelium album PN500]|eukprot:XP_020428223.1 hypothetical protein PPL_10668 [Heterostelium album PN500]
MVFKIRFVVNYSKLPVRVINQENGKDLLLKEVPLDYGYGSITYNNSLAMAVPLKATGKFVTVQVGATGPIHKIVDDDYKILLDGVPIYRYESDSKSECCLRISGGDNPEFITVELYLFRPGVCPIPNDLTSSKTGQGVDAAFTSVVDRFKHRILDEHGDLVYVIGHKSIRTKAAQERF